jgi:hypothetical protein
MERPPEQLGKRRDLAQLAAEIESIEAAMLKPFTSFIPKE